MPMPDDSGYSGRMRFIQGIARVAAILSCILIIVLSLLPRLPQPVRFIGADKVGHALAYCLMSFLFCLGFLKPGTSPGRLIALLGALILLGAGIEFLQPLVGRNFDIIDMLANGSGVGLGYIMALLPRRLVLRAA